LTELSGGLLNQAWFFFPLSQSINSRFCAKPFASTYESPYENVEQFGNLLERIQD
jgi:hypothetical protein